MSSGRKMFTRYLAVLLLLPAGLASAVGLKVSPPQVLLAPGQMSAELRLSNGGDFAVSIEAGVQSWQQTADGGDTKGKAPELVIYPKVFILQPGDSQVVRVGRMPDAPLQPERELAYRLSLQELPVDSANRTIGVSRRLTLPVWLTPTSKHEQWALTDVRKELAPVSVEESERLQRPSSLLIATVKNSGNVHQRVVDVSFIALGSDGQELARATGPAWYVLADSSRSFRANLPESFCDQAAALRVSLRLPKSQRDSDWPLASVCGG